MNLEHIGRGSIIGSAGEAGGLRLRACISSRVFIRLALNGRQGGKRAFKFDPLPLPLDMSARVDADSPLKMYVDGTIVGRVTTRGTIRVALQTRRCIRFNEGGSSIGTKIFDVKSDEKEAGKPSPHHS